MKIRPFLKWAGSKYSSLDAILSSFPNAERLIEPFAGSAVISLNTDFDSYILGEENKDIINIFQHLQQEGDCFINYCEAYFCKENNTPEQYYFFRNQFNSSTHLKERAALFLYLNRHGYNGLCRYNQKGIYNVPFGRYVKPYFPRLEMKHFHIKSQNAELTNADFRVTFAKAKKGDVIYCDPPYVPIAQKSNFSSYTQNQFGEEEQILLANLAVDCASRGITVIISNHDTAFTRYHYRHGKIKTFSVKRHISCQVQNRKRVKELLAIFS